MGRPDLILPFDAAVIQMNVHNRDSADRNNWVSGLFILRVNSWEWLCKYSCARQAIIGNCPIYPNCMVESIMTLPLIVFSRFYLVFKFYSC